MDISPSLLEPVEVLVRPTVQPHRPFSRRSTRSRSGTGPCNRSPDDTEVPPAPPGLFLGGDDTSIAESQGGKSIDPQVHTPIVLIKTHSARESAGADPSASTAGRAGEAAAADGISAVPSSAAAWPASAAPVKEGSPYFHSEASGQLECEDKGKGVLLDGELRHSHAMHGGNGESKPTTPCRTPATALEIGFSGSRDAPLPREGFASVAFSRGSMRQTSSRATQRSSLQLLLQASALCKQNSFVPGAMSADPSPSSPQRLGSQHSLLHGHDDMSAIASTRAAEGPTSSANATIRAVLTEQPPSWRDGPGLYRLLILSAEHGEVHVYSIPSVCGPAHRCCPISELLVQRSHVLGQFELWGPGCHGAGKEPYAVVTQSTFDGLTREYFAGTEPLRLRQDVVLLQSLRPHVEPNQCLPISSTMAVPPFPTPLPSSSCTVPSEAKLMAFIRSTFPGCCRHGTQVKPSVASVAAPSLRANLMQRWRMGKIVKKRPRAMPRRVVSDDLSLHVLGLVVDSDASYRHGLMKTIGGASRSSHVVGMDPQEVVQQDADFLRQFHLVLIHHHCLDGPVGGQAETFRRMLEAQVPELQQQRHDASEDPSAPQQQPASTFCMVMLYTRPEDGGGAPPGQVKPVVCLSKTLWILQDPLNCLVTRNEGLLEGIKEVAERRYREVNQAQKPVSAWSRPRHPCIRSQRDLLEIRREQWVKVML